MVEKKVKQNPKFFCAKPVYDQIDFILRYNTSRNIGI